MQAERPIGSTARSFFLVATILTLAGATFADETIHRSVFWLRYIFAALLLGWTLAQGGRFGIPLRSLPRPGRLLLSSTWLLVIVAAFSVSWSVDPGETAQQVIVLVELALIMHVHATRRWHMPRTLAADLRIIFWTLAATVILSLGTGTIVGSGRLGGLYDNPNTLGIISAYTIALGVGLWSEEHSRLVLAASVLAGFALLASENRSGLIGLIVAGLWLAARRMLDGRINPIAVIVACWTAAATIAAYTLLNSIPFPRVASRFTDGSSQEGILAGRIDGWNYALELWHRQELTGYGFRVGEVIFQQDRYLTSFTADGAHNSYLQMLLELGYLGMVPFALMMLAVLWAVLRTNPVGLSAGVVALAVTGLAMAFVESAMFGVGQHICWVFWLVATALCSASVAGAPGSRDDASRETVERSSISPR